jgi:REP-associated tyrosine transposase
MKMDNQHGEQKNTYNYQRRSTRLQGHDYTWTRAYFVTTRAKTHDPIFENQVLHQILEETWYTLPQRFPGITLDAFVIMPDHVHFIIWLNGLVKPAPTLGQVVGAYKSLVMLAWIRHCDAAHINNGGSFWLSRFHDEIIDSKEHLERIRHYIRDNPSRLESREG